MAKPSPKPQPIGQNADGSYIYEPEQNMSMMPKAPVTPITTAGTGIPGVGIPGVKGLTTPIAPSMGGNLPPVTFSPERAKEINAPVTEDPLQINAKIDNESERTKNLREHFEYLKEKGMYKLNSKQTDYITRFKAKNPAYKNVPDTILYSKIILADPKREEEYGNVGMKPITRRLFDLSVGSVRDFGESLMEGVDAYQKYQEAYKGTPEERTFAMTTGAAVVSGVGLGVGNAFTDILGNIINTLPPSPKAKLVGTTSGTEYLLKQIGDITTPAFEWTKEKIDGMKGEGWTEEQITSLAQYMEENPIAKANVEAAMNILNILPGGFAGRSKQALSVKQVLRQIAKDAELTIGKKGLFGTATKDILDAGMQRSLLQDLTKFSPNEFVKRQTAKLNDIPNEMDEVPAETVFEEGMSKKASELEQYAPKKSNINAALGIISAFGNDSQAFHISTLIEDGLQKGKTAQEIGGKINRFISQQEQLNEHMSTVGKEGIVYFIEKRQSGEITSTFDDFYNTRKNPVPETPSNQPGYPVGDTNAVAPSGEAFNLEKAPGIAMGARDTIFNNKPDEDLAMRAINPRQLKSTTPKQIKESAARSLESLEQMYSDQRTGKITADISTMQGGAEAIDEGLSFWGKRIGEMTRGKAVVQVADISDILKGSLTDPKTKLNPELRTLAETVVSVLGDDRYISGISIEELQSVISDIKGQIFSDKKRIMALSKETAGRALGNFLDILGQRFDDAIEAATGDVAGLKEAKAAYSRYLRIQKDFLNSYLVDQRGVKGGLSGLAGTAMGAMELLKNPTPGGITRAVMLKMFLAEVGLSKSRGGAYSALIRSLDRKALTRNPSLFGTSKRKAPSTPKTTTVATPITQVPVGETPGQNLAKVLEMRQVTPEKALEKYKALDNTEKAKALEASPKLAEYVEADALTSQINEYKGDFGIINEKAMDTLADRYMLYSPETKEFIRKNLGKEELATLQEINRKNMGKKAPEPVETLAQKRKVLEPGETDYSKAKGEIYNPNSKTDKKTATNITAGAPGRRGVIVPDEVITEAKMLPPGSPVWKQMEDGQWQDPKGYWKQLEKDLMDDKKQSLGLGSVWDNGSRKTADELFYEIEAQGVVDRDEFIKLMTGKEAIKDENLLKLVDDFEKTNEWTNIQYADEMAEMKLQDTEIGLFRTQFGDQAEQILDSVRYMHKAGHMEVTGELGKTGKRSKYLVDLEDATNELNTAQNTDYTPDEIFNIASEYLDEIRRRHGKFQTIATRYAEAPEVSAQQVREILGEDFPVTLVDKLETPEGKKAMGMYYQGAIEIAKNPVSTTGYHEAFHAWTELYGDETVLKKAFDQVKRERGYTKNIDAEEYLAEAFAEWKLAGKGSYTGAVKQFFQTLWNDIKGIIGKQDQVLKMFKDVGKKNKVKELQKNLAFQEVGYQSPNGLTTKVLEQLQGRQSVSKEYIQNLLKSAEVKQVERDIFTEKLANFPDKVDVGELSDQVRAELLPLKIVNEGVYSAHREGTSQIYKKTTLPDELKGDVSKYYEKVYESPIKNTAGDKHFGSPDHVRGTGPDGYFGHTRIEDMRDGTTRRVIEVQSDLYQKNSLEYKVEQPHSVYVEQFDKLKAERFPELGVDDDIPNSKLGDFIQEASRRARQQPNAGLKKLKQYNDPTAHFRMVREEIAKAAKDGKTKLQFPTGETAMKVEGLGQNFNNAWTTDKGMVPLKPNYLKVGMEARNGNMGDWVITNVLGDGKFKAVPKRIVDDILKEPSYEATSIKDAIRELQLSNPRAEEVFDISGKVDTSNPIYKFYENDMQKYLKKFDAKRVTDDQGVEWFEVPIKEEYGKKPVQAFQEENMDEFAPILRGTKGLTADDIMQTYPNIKLKRDVPATTLDGQKVMIPEGEKLTPYELKGNKILLQDGETYIVSKNQFQNIKGQSVVAEGKPFAPELDGVEETVLGKKTGGNVPKEIKDEWQKYLNMPATKIWNLSKTEKDRIDVLREMMKADPMKPTKYENEKLTLPGGENYREILIKAPETQEAKIIKEEINTVKHDIQILSSRQGGGIDDSLKYGKEKLDKQSYLDELQRKYNKLKFKSTHWDEEDVAAHLRMNDRTYNGKKVAFMEELQSDWAREGRSKGFIGEKYSTYKKDNGKWIVATKNRPDLINVAKEFDTEIDAKNAIQTVITEDPSPGIPNNPLLKNWQELAIKRALKEAVDSDAEYFSWITGKQTSDRYKLSTQVDSINWEEKMLPEAMKVISIQPTGSRGFTIYIDKNGSVVSSSNTYKDWDGKKIDDVLGKGIADKIMSDTNGKLEGEGLNFGGEWAKTLYDKQVGNIVRDLTGADIEKIDINIKDAGGMWVAEENMITKELVDEKNLYIGMEIADKNRDRFIVTEIPDNGTFMAHRKLTEGMKRDIGYEYYQKNRISNGGDGREFGELSVGEQNEYIWDYMSIHAEEFEIPKKGSSSKQQAIKLTPEIKARIRGEAPKIETSGKKFAEK